MSTISVNNNYSGGSTYIVKKNNEAKINSLMKERESLQEELQSLQKEIASTNSDESETVEAEIESLQSQITNIDSQIARLQAAEEEEEEKKVISNASNNDGKVEYPSQKLDNHEALNITLNKLGENTKLLENEIILDKARGFNTEDKDRILSNIKNNIENINSKLQDVNGDESKKTSEDIELVGNFVDSEA
ncbi:hypothetical protein [Clostridium tertium]|uniref:Uncharacterized protein n=1 Tax=Clostridium tertium TaxID=1559 RepID=A0A6N2YX64_9CLOT